MLILSDSRKPETDICQIYMSDYQGELPLQEQQAKLKFGETISKLCLTLVGRRAIC